VKESYSRPVLAKLARPYLKNKPGTVINACNPSYMGSGGRRISVLYQARQKDKTL
jgi:hypothetical protein